jgi:hypothetical protein
LNVLENDILQKSNSSRPDVYPRVVRYASSKGVSRRQVDKIMLEVAGGYSSATDEEIKKQAETFCEAQYEECLKKQKDGGFGNCGDQLQPCKEKFIADQLKKSKSKSFWGNVVKGINTLGGVAKEYSTTKSGQNLGEFENRGSDIPTQPQETRILGMKPLVFTVVALGTVTTLAIVTVLLMRKGKK